MNGIYFEKKTATLVSGPTTLNLWLRLESESDYKKPVLRPGHHDIGSLLWPFQRETFYDYFSGNYLFNNSKCARFTAE